MPLMAAKYEIVIAPLDGDPPVEVFEAATMKDVWSEMERAISLHPDEHYCEVSNRETGGCIFAIQYELNEV